MNKKLLKQFREIATKLEVTFEKRIISVTGQQLIDTGNSIIDSQQINPELSYQIETQAPANHYRKLKEAYKFGGIKSCNDYIRSVNEVVQRANIASIDIDANMEIRKQQFEL
jgi:hypothetical protein